MSELTFQDQALHTCLDCSFKHAVDLKSHLEKTDPDYKTLEKIIDSMVKEIGMKPEEYKSYEKIREVEHKLEDYQSVLREMRRKTQTGEHSNPDPKREYKPYAWTECEKAHPQVQRKIISCAKQIEKRQTCPPDEWGKSKECVNPFATCRASIRCPP